MRPLPSTQPVNLTDILRRNSSNPLCDTLTPRELLNLQSTCRVASRLDESVWRRRVEVWYPCLSLSRASYSPSIGGSCGIANQQKQLRRPSSWRQAVLEFDSWVRVLLDSPRAWPAEEGPLVRVWAKSAGHVVEFCQDGGALLSADWAGRVVLHGVEGADGKESGEGGEGGSGVKKLGVVKEKRTLLKVEGKIRSLAVAKTGLVVAGDSDGSVHMITRHSESHTEVHSHRLFGCHVMGVCVLDDPESEEKEGKEVPGDGRPLFLLAVGHSDEEGSKVENLSGDAGRAMEEKGAQVGIWKILEGGRVLEEGQRMAVLVNDQKGNGEQKGVDWAFALERRGRHVVCGLDSGSLVNFHLKQPHGVGRSHSRTVSTVPESNPSVELMRGKVLQTQSEKGIRRLKMTDRYLVVGTLDGTVMFYNLDELTQRQREGMPLREILCFSLRVNKGYGVQSLFVSDEILGTGLRDGNIYFYDMKKLSGLFKDKSAESQVGKQQSVCGSTDKGGEENVDDGGEMQGREVRSRVVPVHQEAVRTAHTRFWPNALHFFAGRFVSGHGGGEMRTW
uniref:Uncharacterized protein n=1 Tax=Chromera velia CCMP2878 TaxID=1169474 RepID=A0A0G4HW61_9ALVE|eukprot:Cvel_8993.t1-p1 / transcript=Cvel_8993.t1 / gene=Cvel_8993 / organism=Chromera_velia_CCMP2878 / gene_product=hypothetical protein / transcript_product=hypothetical protein / location=Cvel_scaffold508:1494-3173(+) / protein_length=560 / sequence_SO=supercontig / SO=protein_coding / is_pseudo=false